MLSANCTASRKRLQTDVLSHSPGKEKLSNRKGVYVMKTTIMKTTTFSMRLCLGLALLVIFTIPSHAQSKFWTTSATAGTVNDEDIGRVELGGGIATLSIAAPAANPAIIRYNVVAVDGLFLSNFPRMTVRFRDSGDDARVVVRLRRYNINTGVQSGALLELDSNDYAPSTSFQTRFVDNCNGMSFDFGTYAYFIEVELTGGVSEPRIGVIQLHSSANCIP